MSDGHRTSVAAAVAAFLLLAAPGAASAGGEVAGTAGAADPALPAMLRLALARSQATDVAATYHLDREGRGANPRHALELAFTPRGARIDGPAGGFTLRLERFGRGDGHPVRHAAPRIDGAWVEYDRGAGLSEWFVNLPQGVEQGWTVIERPAGGGPLVLELDTGRPPDDNGDQRLAWSGLVYHQLVALDADGRELPAVWTADGTRLRIEVDDRDTTYPLLIDPWVEQAKLVAEDGAASDGFGFSVALAGDIALVGANVADVGGNAFQGAAYVFIRSSDTWSQQAKLTADDGVEGDEFGDSVALAGNAALVGAPFADVGGNGNQGAVYVFTRSGGTWSQQDKLTADDGAAGDEFGVSVALAGDTALVGAWRAAVDDNDAQGAAYVFTRSDDTWSQQDKLTAEDGAAFENFSVSVALAGDTALVGAWRAAVDGNDEQGAAYVFTRSDDTWSQQDKLTADEGGEADQFGVSVALAGDTALVGAWQANVDGNAQQGAAYVFTRSGEAWSQEAKLVAEDGAVGDRFGVSVAREGDTALVGARHADLDGNVNQGAAYVFTRSAGLWSQQARLTAHDGAASDFFGVSAALASDTVLVGAVFADIGGNVDQGAAYVFARAEPELSFDPASLDFGDVELGGSETRTAMLENTGDADATELDFQMSGEGFESDTAGCEPSLPAGGSCTVEVTFSPTQIGPYEGSLTVNSAEGAAAELALLGSGVSKSEVFAPVALTVDAVPILSDANQVFESGERVEVAPAWRNDGAFPRALTGTAADFTGPDGPTYTLVFDAADYGEVEPGEIASCRPGEMCYEMEIGPAGAPRPATHWDAGFDETLSDDTVKTWILHLGDSFADTPRMHQFYRFVETLLHHGVSSGCGDGVFCPDLAPTRAAIAVLLLKAAEGPDFVPSACTPGEEAFLDVPADSPFCPWIEELSARGITSGCGDRNYCPADPVIRAPLALLVLRTLEGPEFEPPACTPGQEVFADVPADHPLCPWIEELFAQGITSGCRPGNYCPAEPATRGQAAAFLSRAFGLVLYGP